MGATWRKVDVISPKVLNVPDVAIKAMFRQSTVNDLKSTLKIIQKQIAAFHYMLTDEHP